jgi:peptidoglycan-associated lipoprotein
MIVVVFLSVEGEEMKKFAIILGLAVAISACSSSVKLDDKDIVLGKGQQGGAPIVPGNNTADSKPVPPNTSSQSGVPTVTVPDPLNDPSNPLSKRSIYFDYDSYSVKDEYKTVVEAHARYLNATKAKKVIIQGNTDERGSREYNLALGQKRAEAVRRSLSALGVAETQLEAVSLGEEKPKATGSDEAAFAENRRADLVYQ